MFKVTMVACTAGNPTKAWAGTTGEDDTEHVPDDVWEEVEFSFDDLDKAKAYVASLHPQLTTHVKLYADDELIFEQDGSADHLDDAAPGVTMPHEFDNEAGVTAVAHVVEELPAFAPPGA